MKKTIKAREAFRLEESLNTLYDQDIKFPINTGFKLTKIRRELSEINSYISSRLVLAIPNLVEDTQSLTNEQIILYNSILDSPIEIDNHDIKEDDVFSNNEVNVNMKIVEGLSVLFT